MRDNFHQSVEDIINTATPAQKIIWNDLFLRFGKNISISQFVYTGGPAAGTLMNTYNARIFYLAYEFTVFTINNWQNVPNQFPVITFYDENNVANMYDNNWIMIWDTTIGGWKAFWNHLELKNIWFSRVAVTNGLMIKLIGFRIGI